MPAKNNTSITEQFLAGAANQQQANTRTQTREDARRAAEQRREDAAAAKEHARVQKAFAEYFRDLAPLIHVLENLPPKNGQEFFVRTDLNLHGDNVRSAEKSIHMWLVYTKPVPDGQKAEDGTAHSLYMPRKGTPAHEHAEAQDLYLSPHGMLHLKMSREGGRTCIETSRAYESYDYAPGGRGQGLYRGDYRQCTGTSHEQKHAKLKDAVPAIGAWVHDIARDRIPDIRAAMDARQNGQETHQLAQSVSVMRPATVRKRIQP